MKMICSKDIHTVAAILSTYWNASLTSGECFYANPNLVHFREIDLLLSPFPPMT